MYDKFVLCIIDNFYPKDITIKWKINDTEAKGEDTLSTRSDQSYTYKAKSFLQVTQTSSDTKYKCEVTHNSKSRQEEISGGKLVL